MRSCVPLRTAEDSGAMRPLQRTQSSYGFMPKYGGPHWAAVHTRRITHGGGPLRAATRAGSPQRLGKEHCLSDLSSFSLFSKKPKETAVGRIPDRGDGTSPGVRPASLFEETNDEGIFSERTRIESSMSQSYNTVSKQTHAFIQQYLAMLQVLGLIHESRNTRHESRLFSSRHHTDATPLLGRASTQRRNKR